MSKRFFWVAFAIGLAAIAWVAQGFAGTNWIAFAMTGAIAVTYLLGAWELRAFRADSAALASALAAEQSEITSLREWLERVPAALRGAVRQRIEEGRGALPGPALTPYLVGLLVMLGMLGTFLGMVLTFKGAVFALEGSTDLQAIRAALAEPIRGLGLSFGTSVAGVAASAMLGLMSAISRRERIEAARALDRGAATVLRPFSPAHQRELALRAAQAQAEVLPAVVEKLEAMMTRIEQRSQQLDERLLESQARFHRDASTAYEQLARDVGESLRESLAAGAQAAGESIRPTVESAMTRIAQETTQLHGHITQETAQLHGRITKDTTQLYERISQETAQLHTRLADAAQTQMGTLSQQFEATARGTTATWQAALKEQSTLEAGRLQAWTQQVQQLLAQSEELVRARVETESRWLAQHGERMDQLAGVWRSELQVLREQEAQRGDAAVQRLDELQGAVAQHLATLGAALEAPLARLLATASEVPQAAAGVLAQLRAEMARLSEQENVALAERTVLVERLGTLVQAVEDASRHASEMAAQAGANAVELSSWGEAFGQSVQQFHASNEKLVAALAQVEGAVTRSTARSDEQLAYYVAQAREVIDLSIASQHGVIERLRELAGKPTGLAPGVTG